MRGRIRAPLRPAFLKKSRRNPRKRECAPPLLGTCDRPFLLFQFFPASSSQARFSFFEADDGFSVRIPYFYQFVTRMYSTIFKLLFQSGTSVGIFFFSILQLF